MEIPQLTGKWPAVVKSWLRDRRECRVEIPSLTDGCEVFPLAQIQYPIGDKSEDTEIWIEEGDRVWVEFERGDSRYPIITGFRAKNTGNRQEWRKFEHENHERDAFDGDIYDHASQDVRQDAGRDIVTEAGRNETKGVAEVYQLTAGTRIKLIVGGSVVDIADGNATVTTNEFIVDAPISTFKGQLVAEGAVTAAAGLAVSGDMTNNGKDIGSGHKHGGSPTAPDGPVSNTGEPV